ncbi:MAG TPA: isoprenylcysteine carboxylmethyltransferase family protein [Sporichthyaceae bacterium]|jgi:protein-S-isoprenylcysteine O-methyltransferase Ste14|nr:isoprenylcysteine carboxylmethyltransferase family protein [Sporichthyaceae bacterium]
MFRTAIYLAWAAFWIYWMVAAANSKHGSSSGGRRVRGLAAIGVMVMARFVRIGSLAVHDPAMRVIGVMLFVSGLALAVWARLNLGRNWGMPMTLKDEPELVTSGPYRSIRHPIYTGILLATLGTAVAVNLDWFLLLMLLCAYFVHSAVIEERLMTSQFPSVYPAYRDRTKMLVPFVL